MKLNKILALACGVVGVVAMGQARAATVDWANWNTAPSGFTTGATSGVATATLTPSLSVRYTGEVRDVLDNYPSWAPGTTYADGVLVNNAPPQSGGIVKLFGGQGTGVNTLTFSAPVVNPVFAIWSLGQGGQPTTFVFNTSSFVLVAGGPSTEYNGQSITRSANVVGGVEGNGTIVFQGTFSSISWTNPSFENWYGFTVGVNGGNAIPLPTASLGGVALLGGLFGRRTRR